MAPVALPGPCWGPMAPAARLSQQGCRCLRCGGGGGGGAGGGGPLCSALLPPQALRCVFQPVYTHRPSGLHLWPRGPNRLWVRRTERVQVEEEPTEQLRHSWLVFLLKGCWSDAPGPSLEGDLRPGDGSAGSNWVSGWVSGWVSPAPGGEGVAAGGRCLHLQRLLLTRSPPQEQLLALMGGSRRRRSSSRVAAMPGVC